MTNTQHTLGRWAIEEARGSEGKIFYHTITAPGEGWVLH